MKTPEHDILVYGDLCANDLLLGEFLARKGLRVHVARKKRQGGNGVELPEGFLQALGEADISHIGGPGDLVALARRSRMVLTFTGAFGFAMSWRWPLRRVLGLPPVFNYPTGSDFSETLGGSGPLSLFYRYFVRTCAMNAGFTYPHILKNILRRRVTNIAFVRHPYLLPEMPADMPPPSGPLRLFHASHLDFKVSDPGAFRNSAKGNDRFLRAFLRALDEGLDADCVLLDRGPDRGVARAMIDESRHAGRFTWLPHLSREAFFAEMARADMVVDQFDVGGLGGIAIEAMALGKPVLTHVETANLNIVYSEVPPVLAAFTEDEICARIMDHRDREQLAEIGAAAKGWVHRNHHWENCLDTLLFYYALLTGHEAVDYGYRRDAYSQ